MKKNSLQRAIRKYPHIDWNTLENKGFLVSTLTNGYIELTRDLKYCTWNPISGKLRIARHNQEPLTIEKVFSIDVVLEHLQ